MTRHLTYPLITKITSIATLPSEDTQPDRQPDRVEIEVHTSLGRGVLRMSQDAASELGAKLKAHLQAGIPRS